MWPSEPAAEQIMKRLEDYDFPYVGESDNNRPLIITIIENGEIFQP